MNKLMLFFLLIPVISRCMMLQKHNNPYLRMINYEGLVRGEFNGINPINNQNVPKKSPQMKVKEIKKDN